MRHGWLVDVQQHNCDVLSWSNAEIKQTNESTLTSPAAAVGGVLPDAMNTENNSYDVESRL